MCGLAGFIDTNISPDVARAVVGQMANQIKHRGPDDSGEWCDPDSGVALAHRRLSILDLSPSGHQPMTSQSGRYRIVFNGEIYNHRELRESLYDSGVVWRGHSDTEVILAAVERWGVRSAVERFVGMFAIALWDCTERTLYLARDRIGEKPLYYALLGQAVLFGSELKSLRVHPKWQDDIDRDAMLMQMRYGYIPAPRTIFCHTFKQLPGSILKISLRDGVLAPVEEEIYWSMQEAAKAGMANQFTGDEGEAISEVERLLRSSISMQMCADVPVGTFLSGGIDSSLVTALMQQMAAQPIRTFTIGFAEKRYDEALHAKEVSRFLGTEHTELYVSPEDAMAVIPQLPALFDEPFGDASQIPTFMVSRLARNDVKVVLSGDGGDEFFYGYSRYAKARMAWRYAQQVPHILRRLMKTPLSLTASGCAMLSKNHLLGSVLQGQGDKLCKAINLVDARTPQQLYWRLLSHWKQGEGVVRNGKDASTAFIGESICFDDFDQWMMYQDSVAFLPDDVLVKVDRASMGVGLETRVPLLDHRLVEFAWRIPMRLKYHQGQGKWLLRQLLYRHVPRELVERPKKGFRVPIDEWLRGPLREWAEALLDEKRLREEGFFEPALVRQRWREHLSGQRNWQYCLWDVLMFQGWLAAQRSDRVLAVY